jgi:NAD(P)-dependent dehydrogenase (short-subunit alcohol dehydrogenase family)
MDGRMSPRRAIFITGAAQGIGAATAERFANAGWFVGLYDLDLAGVQALRDRLGGENAIAGRLDVRDGAAWTPALQSFWDAAQGRLDVLLNNAGIATSGDFESLPLSTHHAIVDVNLKGVINGAHAGHEFLRRHPGGGARLINLASASAIYGAAGLASYSATKFAVRGLTEALDLEWRAQGIRVCDLWPLFVSTKMVDSFSLPTIRSLGVRLTPEDVAGAIWTAAHHAGHRVHWPVGVQAHALYRAASWLPDRLIRNVTARLSGHR